MKARIVACLAVCLALLFAIGCGLPNAGESETPTRTDTEAAIEPRPSAEQLDPLTDRPSSAPRETDAAPTAPRETSDSVASDSGTDTMFVKPTETDAPKTDRVTNTDRGESETAALTPEPPKPTETKADTGTETATEAKCETDAPARTAFTVRLNPNGGELTDEIMTVTYGATYTLPYPFRIGYEFVGWQDGDTMLEQSGTWLIAEDVTLTAVWRAA